MHQALDRRLTRRYSGRATHAPLSLGVRHMNTEAAEILATALENEAANHERGNYDSIGNKWDHVYAELLPIENDIDNSIYGLAFRFWDDWCNSANHDWQYHELMVKDMWPRYARKIADSLRNRKLPDNQVILDNFLPRPTVSLKTKVIKWFSRNA